MNDYREHLRQMFPNYSDPRIDEVIRIVAEECGLVGEEQMINFLVESGDSTLNVSEDGAVGLTLPGSNNDTEINQHLSNLISIFPDIDPTFLKNFCQRYESFNFDQIMTDLSEMDYVKVTKDPIDMWKHLSEMLPHADPTYLRNHARVLVNRPPEELEKFISDAVEKGEYPTMQDYLKNREATSNMEIFVTRFSVSKYLEFVPNPLDIYLNSNRKSSLEENADKNDIEFALCFLYNNFLYQRRKEIDKIFNHYNKNLVLSCSKLKTFPKAFRHPREIIDYPECKNLSLLKEIGFLKHEKQVRQFLKQKDEKYRLAYEDAKINGLLETCGCCYDEDLIPEECYFCAKGCLFCKNCVKMGAEQVIGKEETRFPCLASCDCEFDYSTIQMVLDSKIFQKVWHRKQIEDVKKANIEGLEMCPFCDYCMIPSEEDKIFKCENVDCMIESCRQCRHKSHVPLRCNEIEYDEDVKMRTFIENKMSEAFVLQCWKCSKKFYKEHGCNKMTCTCGAKMCYICKKPVDDYSHFGSGNKCPLYTENLREFHLAKVRESAAAAKEELGINLDPNKLKFDPIRGIDDDIA